MRNESRDFIEGTSPDLAYELQFETIKQMTTLSVAGVGLIVTLAGSILSDVEDISRAWVAMGMCALGGLISLSLQLSAAGSLFERRPHRLAITIGLMLNIALIGGAGGIMIAQIEDAREQREAAANTAAE